MSNEFSLGADQASQQPTTQQPQVQADQPFLVSGERVFKTPEEVSTKIESADMFIDQLKKENEMMRQQLESSSKVGDVLEALKQKQEPTPTTQTVVEEEHTPSINETSVEEMVQKALVSAKATELASANLANATTAFSSKFGEKASEVYSSKLAELNMTAESATKLAQTSPEAFKTLFVGAPMQSPSSSIASSSGVNTAALSQKPNDPVKVHQIKDKASRIQEISRRIEEASKKYHNGTL